MAPDPSVVEQSSGSRQPTAVRSREACFDHARIDDESAQEREVFPVPRRMRQRHGRRFADDGCVEVGTRNGDDGIAGANRASAG